MQLNGHFDFQFSPQHTLKRPNSGRDFSWLSELATLNKSEIYRTRCERLTSSCLSYRIKNVMRTRDSSEWDFNRADIKLASQRTQDKMRADLVAMTTHRIKPNRVSESSHCPQTTDGREEREPYAQVGGLDSCGETCLQWEDGEVGRNRARSPTNKQKLWRVNRPQVTFIRVEQPITAEGEPRQEVWRSTRRRRVETGNEINQLWVWWTSYKTSKLFHFFSKIFFKLFCLLVLLNTRFV